MADSIFIGMGVLGGEQHPQALVLRRANRHGLIAGATGTGKTVTLQTLAEGFSRDGVPVFMADVKGDIAGMAMVGNAAADWTTKRAAEVGIEGYSFADNPVVFWDLFGEQGHPIRTTVSEMGPLLLARLMGLNETQEGVLSVAFKYADENGLLILDLKDLQSVLAWCADNAAELASKYGNVTKASVGTIQRQLLQLESQGAAHFFGEPALDIADFLTVDDNGRGQVNILAADKLMQSPRLYATFLLWLLSELFETLPEVGDPPKPKLVFFFDEAHLLFDEAPKALLDKIEQVVRLIRSKGCGVYFISQNPIDIPESVAGQLGNRVQHALRAFTPKDQKAIRAASETFRANPGLNVGEAITQLKVGEALVSLLQDDGSPSPVERTLIAPPRSRVGPITTAERKVMVDTSVVAGRYEAAVDRESAYEILNAKSAAAQAQANADAAKTVEEKAAAIAAKAQAKADADMAKAAAVQARVDARPVPQSQAGKIMESVARSAASSIGRQVASGLGRSIGGRAGGQIAGTIGSSLLRGILGSLFR